MPRLPAFDLNSLTSPTPARSSYDWTRRRRGASSGATTAHLGDIAGPLSEFLRGSEAVVGCVAWVTSTRLVDALVGRPVSLVLTKEWHLRSIDTKASSVRSRANLARLTGGLRRGDFPAPLSDIAGHDDIEPVRVAGHIPRARTANSPLMHHKFVVRLEGGQPVAVWTGSFNFTVNAESSFENAVEIHDPVIAAAFLAEWARVATVSEPLDFAGGKAAPSWGARRPAAVAKPVARARKKAPAAQKPAAKKAAPKKPAAARATSTKNGKPATAKRPAAARTRSKA
ncbi:hypothetical protein [Frigoribacterium sp. SL97]|uniref:hypothetical protein n=1 Tax=Frigoribacterium sp. SL97 TaxID=2994664 RepID=UPI00226EE4AF|nr:hypothetical protein [Frigoribacterium sp. SL97]WAC50559.1 hypothetical protein OVA02_11815 [Frigoribacterium sp. SL97]